jgi:hypothetical protein
MQDPERANCGGEEAGLDPDLARRFARIEDEIRALFAAYQAEAGEVPARLRELAEALDRARREGVATASDTAEPGG